MARFFSEEWAEEVRAAVDAGPSEEARSAKLPEYWGFIDFVRQTLDCTVALGARGIPGESETRYVVLTIAGGKVTDARVAGTAGIADVTYVLEGDYPAWVEIMGGFDAGKAIMYRKLLLEKGVVLDFFKGIYFFVESLAVIQQIPTEMPEAEPALAGNT